MITTMITLSDGSKHHLNFPAETLAEVYTSIRSAEYLTFKDTANRLIFVNHIVSISEVKQAE